MLCEISTILANGSFFWTWINLSALAFVLLLSTSGTVFYFYYAKSQITYEKWSRKSNPKYPAPTKVRDEIVQMTKGMLSATLLPTTALWLADENHAAQLFGVKTQGFCGTGGYSWWYHVGCFAFIWVTSDFFEFFYHYLGHSFKSLWKHHKAHHRFFNPTPFAVIADEFVDQFVRASPLLVFPLLMPVNIDLLFLEYAFFFYGYGIVLHWGYEFDFLDAHNPYINTAYHHYLHHAKSIVFKPYHTGFFFKIWDQLFGSVYEGDCFCAKCERGRGNRTREQFEKVKFQDYSVLLQPSFWLTAETLTGQTSSEKNTLFETTDKTTPTSEVTEVAEGIKQD